MCIRDSSLTSDEWNSDKNGGPYKDKAGYQMSDLIGKSGLESALESYLHSTAGSRTVETDLGGSAIAEQTTACLLYTSLRQRSTACRTWRTDVW